MSILNGSEGTGHVTQINAIIGEQSALRKGFLVVHAFYAIGASFAALYGIFHAIEGESGVLFAAALIGGVMGILVSDITLFATVVAIERRELIGADLNKARTLHYIALADVTLGMLAKGMADFAVWYYALVMPVSMSILFYFWIELILYGEGASVEREQKEMDLNDRMNAFRLSYERRRDLQASQLALLEEGRGKRRVNRALTTTLFGAMTDIASGVLARRRIYAIARRKLYNMIGTREPKEYASFAGRFNMRSISGDGQSSDGATSTRNLLSDVSLSLPDVTVTPSSVTTRRKRSTRGTRHGNQTKCAGCGSELPDGWSSIYCRDESTGKPSNACKQKRQRQKALRQKSR